MSHPDELLAEYVDGSLPSRERATVDAHLASCERCRAEVALADAGRSALGSVPEVPAPAGLLLPALEAAGAVAGVVRPRWQRFAGAAAAAAAAVLVAALVLPSLGDGPGDEAGRDRAGAEAAPAAGGDAALADAPSLEILQADYDADDLQSLTQPYVERFASPQDGAGGAGGAQEAATLASRPAGAAKSRAALRCLATAAPQAAGRLQRLLQARFQGEPAYFAIFLEGDAERPDKATVYVVAADDCTIRSFAQARI